MINCIYCEERRSALTDLTKLLGKWNIDPSIDTVLI
jgi:hypothetical protein